MTRKMPMPTLKTEAREGATPLVAADATDVVAISPLNDGSGRPVAVFDADGVRALHRWLGAWLQRNPKP